MTPKGTKDKGWGMVTLDTELGVVSDLGLGLVS